MDRRIKRARQCKSSLWNSSEECGRLAGDGNMMFCFLSGLRNMHAFGGTRAVALVEMAAQPDAPFDTFQ